MQILREAMQQTLTNTILRETLLNKKDLSALKNRLGDTIQAVSKKELERLISENLAGQPVPKGHYRSVLPRSNEVTMREC